MPNLKRDVPDQETKAEEFVREASLPELVEMLAELEREFGERGIIHSADIMHGLACTLFAQRFGWDKEDGGAFDCVTELGQRVKVVAAKAADRPIPCLTIGSPEGFDHMAVMIFDADFSVKQALLMTQKAVEESAEQIKGRGGYFLNVTAGTGAKIGVHSIGHKLDWVGLNDTTFGFDSDPTFSPDD